MQQESEDTNQGSRPLFTFIGRFPSLPLAQHHKTIAACIKSFEIE